MTGDEEIYEELRHMTARFERDANDLNLAIFQLPDFTEFKAKLKAADRGEDVSVAFNIGTEMDDPLRDVAKRAGVNMFIIDNTGAVVPRPDGMGDQVYIRYTAQSARVKFDMVGPYAVFTHFTGASAESEGGEVRLYEVAIQRLRDGKPIGDVLYTDDKTAALSAHDSMVADIIAAMDEFGEEGHAS